MPLRCEPRLGACKNRVSVASGLGPYNQSHKGRTPPRAPPEVRPTQTIEPMKNAAGALAFIVRFVILGLALAFVVGLFWPGSGDRLRARFGLGHAPQASASTEHPAAAQATVPAQSNGPVSYADAVAKAAPSVVNIYANKMVTARAVQMYDDPVLQRLFGGLPTGPAYKRPQQVLGSGVIVSDKGYVLTNNHVIANADDIQVLL